MLDICKVHLSTRQFFGLEVHIYVALLRVISCLEQSHRALLHIADADYLAPLVVPDDGLKHIACRNADIHGRVCHFSVLLLDRQLQSSQVFLYVYGCKNSSRRIVQVVEHAQAPRGEHNDPRLVAQHFQNASIHLVNLRLNNAHDVLN